MNKPTLYRHQAWQNDLARVIEPLASLICAADRPQAAFSAAVAVLLREVEQTNQAAAARCGLFAESAA
jgi:hypothetical protein